ncbi:beta strand repeat-containing protein, partial [Psittacicella hinzii]
MNKVFKLKFSKAKQQVVVTSELAKAAEKGSAATSVDSTLVNAAASEQVTTNKNSRNLTTSLVAGLGAILSLGLVDTQALASDARTGMDIVCGTAVLSQVGNLTQITTSTDKTILNWNKFNINQEEIVEFIQKSSNAAVLNRVLGGSVSQILGQLKSNGVVFIVNPAGVVFGKNSHVDVSGLVTSTLDITDKDFINGNYVFNQEKDRAIAAVINQGMIKVQENGTLALIGGLVVNNGALEAKNGTVYLLAGNSITISDFTNPHITYTVTAGNKAVNLGSIVAKNVSIAANKVVNGYTSATEFADIMSNYGSSANSATINANGEVVLYGASENVSTSFNNEDALSLGTNNTGLVVNNGTINVSNSVVKGGTVKVLGDQVVIEDHSEINASGVTGGEVYLGGDFKGAGNLKLANTTYVAAGSVVNVSATNDAGKVAVWGNQAYIGGSFLAKSEKGKGGYLETSAKYIAFDDSFNVETVSQKGKEYTGQWFIDPFDFTIVNSSATTCGSTPASWYQGIILNQIQANSVPDSFINNQLKTTDVTIGVDGNITAHNVYIYSDRRFFTLYSTGGWLNITNSTFNFTGNKLTIVSQKDFIFTNSVVTATNYTIGTYEENGNTKYTTLNYTVNLSNSRFTSTDSNKSYIRATTLGDFIADNATFSSVNSELDIRYNGNAKLTNSSVDAATFTLRTDIGRDKGVINTHSTLFSNTTVNVTKGFSYNNNHASLDMVNSTLNGSTTANISIIANTYNATSTDIDGKNVTICTTNGTINLNATDINATSNIVLNSTGGNVNFSNANLTVSEGDLVVCATNNVAITSDNVRINLGADSNLSVYGGNNTLIQDANFKARFLSVDGGNVTVTNSTLASTYDTKIGGANLSITNASNITGNNTNIVGSNVTINKFSKVNATNNVAVNVTNFTLADSWLESVNTSICVTNNALITGSNVTSTQDTFIAAGNLVISNHSNITGLNLNITGNSILSNEGVSVVATNNAAVYSKGNLSLDGINVTAGNTVNVDGGNVSIANQSNIAGQAVNVNGRENATIDNSVLASPVVNVTGGNLTLQNGALVNATIANINGTNVVVDSAKVNATDININSTNSTLLSNAAINATGNANLSSNLNLTLSNGTKVNATNANLNSGNGSVNVIDANVTANVVNLTAKENISLDNSNITGKANVSLTT